MFRTSQKYFWRNSSCVDHFHPYGNIIIITHQPHRSIALTGCRYKVANLNARNYYELLGVERTATQKEIKKAFFNLSKEYHPDANSADKSLHDKFVKINEAFSILSKQSTRIIYDQSLTSVSRPSYQAYSRPASPDWSNMNFGSRNTSQTDWNSRHYDKEFYDMFRRRMEYDRQHYSPARNFQSNYFASISIILMIIGFGMFIHALQWRIMRFSDPQYAVDPRTRHYHAYREWQRLSALKEAESMPIRSSTEEK